MDEQTYGERKARQAAQVALEFARQMGGTFIPDTGRRISYVERSTIKEQGRR
ncbi:hypothetical protein [Sphingomonas rubra]|uniref:hypothetical protein n=1 Tax=Sphingomonas rubra TaxID=634430 RepID=UPI0015A70915|nr:hypothetical protein [Sphingomonas rubra]